MWDNCNLTVIPIVLLMVRLSSTLRCYTDIKMTKSQSADCGENSGCVKIFKKPDAFDPDTKLFIPLHKRSPELQLFRGCFLVKTGSDVCYDSPHKLSYCWCNHSDLCNTSTSLRHHHIQHHLVLLLASLLTVGCWRCNMTDSITVR